MRQSPAGDAKGFEFGAEGIWGWGWGGGAAASRFAYSKPIPGTWHTASNTYAFNAAHVVN